MGKRCSDCNSSFSSKKWIKEIEVIREVSCIDNQCTKRFIKCDSNNKVFLSSVAYTNCDNKAGDEERITWSTTKNTIILNASHRSELTGYIKDSAWDYEKEIRIKALINNIDNYERVAVDIPDWVLDSLKITASPLFDGDILTYLKEKLSREYITDKSIFTNMLYIDSFCSKCEKKGESK